MFTPGRPLASLAKATVAASILLPMPLVGQRIRDGAASIDQLAAKLRVAKGARSIRLAIPAD